MAEKISQYINKIMLSFKICSCKFVGDALIITMFMCLMVYCDI